MPIPPNVAARLNRQMSERAAARGTLLGLKGQTKLTLLADVPLEDGVLAAGSKVTLDDILVSERTAWGIITSVASKVTVTVPLATLRPRRRL